MNESLDKLKRIKVDCLYGKKKHFNAADRGENNNYLLGIPLILVNIISASVIFYEVTSGSTGIIKYLPLGFILLATILSGFQTFFNFPRITEGHRRIANKYLSLYKKCDRIQGYVADNIINQSDLIVRIEGVASEVDMVNREAEGFPTNASDYNKAKEGIEDGEESYSDEELKL